ncbi:BTB/POZ domain-containing protein 17-like [Saccoglossus kowalevskii]|uniref:Kelch-like protein 28-like n=1 Tax=Saccoglossus kowalevskii TaxID=10224 RepID=A0ABM0GTQ3_SACKO|nr:PREDICTED: kelch-like protein 28-like [Saccoglossus kowalevskii]
MDMLATHTPAGEWITNDRQILDSFGRLYNNPEISDVTLHVEDTTYYAHKVFLANASDVFKVMLTSRDWQDSSKPDIYLDEPYATATVFGEFLRYIYTGQIYINTDVAVSLLMLADKYNMVDLKKACQSFMERNFVTIAAENHVLSWYQYSKRCGHKDLERICYMFIQNNMDIILESPDWHSMEKETLLMILRSSDIILTDEHKLYLGVEDWLTQPINENDLQQNLKDTLQHVRFPMMTPKQLISIEKREFVKENWQHYQECMLNAYRFNSVPQCLRQNENFDEVEIYTHRNYTHAEYNICATIKITQYSQRKPFEYSCSFDAAKTGSYADNCHKYKWELQFWPRGLQKPALTEFGNAYMIQTDEVTLAITPQGRNENAFKIVAAVIGYEDGLQYVKHVHRITHDFGTKMMFRIKHLIKLGDLMSDSSKYLNADCLQVYVIIRQV